MYPQPPPQHRPTNYYWVLLACMAAMLLFLFVGLRQIASRFSATGSDQAPLITEAPRASAKPALTVAPQATATVAASAAPAATATAEGGVVDVDAKSLTQSPANYRSRLVRVRGTVFYTGKLENGKTWI